MQAAINAARVDLPATLRSNPTYRKVNPGRVADHDPRAHVADAHAGRRSTTPCRTIVQQRLLAGARASATWSSAAARCRPCASRSIPFGLSRYGMSLEDVRTALNAANPNRPKGAIEDDALHYQIYSNDNGRAAANYRNLVIALSQRRRRALERCRERRRRRRRHPHAGPLQRQPGGDRERHASARREHHRDRRRRAARCCRSSRRTCPATSSSTSRSTVRSRSARRCTRSRSRC